MENKIQVLLSVMNLKDEGEFDEIIKRNNIKSDVLAVNQVDSDLKLFNIEDKRKRLHSYNEKGASISRNRLLEKANGDICIFADDDTQYVENYEEIISNEYSKNPNADVIIFFVENNNAKREKNKKIGRKKMTILDIMKVRTYEITLKKETLLRIRKNNIQFNSNFGPGGEFLKGEETIWLSELMKKGFKIYSVDKKIGIAENQNSTWFTGYNEKYLYDQGAIFYKLAPKMYMILILQYLVRKYFQYRKNVKFIDAYKQMILGAKDCKRMNL